jgi:hypothetical protein
VHECLPHGAHAAGGRVGRGVRPGLAALQAPHRELVRLQPLGQLHTRSTQGGLQLLSRGVLPRGAAALYDCRPSDNCAYGKAEWGF